MNDKLKIVALLREDPHAAFDIVRSANIAGPRRSWGSDPACSGRKPLHGGNAIAVIMEEGADLCAATRFTTGRIYGYFPMNDRRQKPPEESMVDFIVRIDQAWRDIGWLLADEQRTSSIGRRSTDI